jgi:hypothetical protein
MTIRNMDWGKMAPYFTIPKNIKDIDFKKIKLAESVKSKKVAQKSPHAKTCELNWNE